MRLAIQRESPWFDSRTIWGLSLWIFQVLLVPAKLFSNSGTTVNFHLSTLTYSAGQGLHGTSGSTGSKLAVVNQSK